MPIFLWFFKNPLGQKVGIVLICVILGFVALNWYGNSQYQQGKAIGVKLGDEDARKSMEATWAKREIDLKTAQDKIIADRAKIDQDAIEVAKIRGTLSASLVQIRAASQTRQENANAIVASVPGDMLDDAIRSKSAALGAPQAIK
jgi:hypothetical protein